MKILVTGGLGVIGSTIALRLHQAGHEVTVIDAAEAERNRWTRDHILPPHPEMRVIPHRLETFPVEHLRNRIAEADAVIHAAASTGIPHSVTHPDDDWRSNVDATRALLEALRLNPRPTVVLSSVKPYKIAVGAMNPTDKDAKGLTEDVPLAPDEPYAASKAAQSMLAMAYAASYGIPVVTFRCSNLYGPAPCHGPRHGWLTWFAISAAIGRPIEVQGTGNQTRDMLHADDVYAACTLALTHARTLSGKVFNLGGGHDNRISVAEAASTFIGLAGTGEVRAAPARAMDDDHVFANTGAFLRATGWRPLVGVRDGMKQVFDWARSNADELREIYKGA